MRRLLIVILLFAPTLFAINPDEQQTARTVDEVLRTMASVRSYYQVAISPDGSRIAWVQGRTPRDHAQRGGIYVAELKSPEKARRISASTGDDAWEEQVAWSPDSKQIAFLSDAGNSSQQQLYVADLGSGNVRRLTSLTGALSSPEWSPDGRGIAILYIKDSPRAAGPLQPMTPPSGVIEERIFEQRVNIVDTTSGMVRAISPADMYVYEYDWAPDSRSLAVTAAHGDGDNNWWIAQLYMLSVNGEMRSIYKPTLQIANPTFSPDGKSVAFIEGLMSDQGSTGGDVYVVAAAGGPARNLTSNMPATATWLAWPEANRILFTQIVDGNYGVAIVTTAGEISQLWNAGEVITAGAWNGSVSLSHDGRKSAVIRSSPTLAPDIWAGPVGEWKQITADNRDLPRQWGESRSLHWQSDNYRVQGWLLFPRNYDSSKRYALVVDVHGGPASACAAKWPNSTEVSLASLGYFVLCPNPRGSYGQGSGFARANVKDFGGGDLRDILAGVDEVLRQFPVDSRRIGIQGWSYGGYMTMWAETQTSRFSAAIAGAGIANWLSYYGQNSIDQWMLPYFGTSVYDDPAVYAKSQPINFVRNVRTPTLILVGDRDGECPAPQSFEWWHALKTFKVPVQFVVYANEGHMIQQSENRRDLIVRSVQWFEKWIGEKSKAAAAQ